MKLERMYLQYRTINDPNVSERIVTEQNTRSECFEYLLDILRNVESQTELDVWIISNKPERYYENKYVLMCE